MKYIPPKVIDEIVLELESEILKSSVIVDDTTVETTGQEFVQYDNDFYHDGE